MRIAVEAIIALELRAKLIAYLQELGQEVG